MLLKSSWLCTLLEGYSLDRKQYACLHSVAAGALLYIEQENLIAGKTEYSRLDLISILALSLAFDAITLERSGFKENPTNFLTSVAR